MYRALQRSYMGARKLALEAVWKMDNIRGLNSGGGGRGGTAGRALRMKPVTQLGGYQSRVQIMTSTGQEKGVEFKRP